MANQFLIRVKASKQGDLKSEVGKDKTLIPILGFSYGVSSPRDAANGQATGKRQHKPLTIYKEWGVISPQLFQALVTNEVLTNVVIDEVRTNPKGQEEVYIEIRLTNAFVSEIEIDPEEVDVPPVWLNQEIEAVSFTFARIEIENKAARIVAENDWSPVT
ncbi:MAG TPA: type VI secretion system tube protein TssD [Anaerolineaceae bacterium]|nr:type VI secretion system tube protein TssD [Anaerolineaceae bacterium]